MGTPVWSGSCVAPHFLYLILNFRFLPVFFHGNLIFSLETFEERSKPVRRDETRASESGQQQFLDAIKISVTRSPI